MATFDDLLSTTASESATGPEIQRAFQVTDITGNADEKCARALSAPKIPLLGDPHPADGRLFAVNKTVTFQTATQAQIIVSYRIPRVDSGDSPPGGTGATGGSPVDLGTITVGASASQRETIFDRKGGLLAVNHDVEVEEFPSDGVGPPLTTLKRISQVRKVEILEPQTVLRIQRIETGSPDLKARRYVGTVNKRSVGKDNLDGPRKWLCTRIDGTSNDGGNVYNVTYEFQHNRGEWGAFVEWIDPETGLPVPLADRNTDMESLFYEVYPEEDFRNLDIAFEGAVGGS